MNREIKFRAWDKKLQKMAYDIQNYYDNLGWDYTPTGVYDSFAGFLNNENQIVMQFTGLLDKNGKEIYEGDITEPQSWIAWCDKCCSFEFFLRDFGCSSCDRDVFWCEIVEDREKLEVIGNIYENPELLK